MLSMEIGERPINLVDKNFARCVFGRMEFRALLRANQNHTENEREKKKTNDTSFPWEFELNFVYNPKQTHNKNQMVKKI